MIINTFYKTQCVFRVRDFPGDSDSKESACNAGVLGSIPEDPSGEGNDNPLQYSCLKNSMDREAWWAPVFTI